MKVLICVSGNAANYSFERTQVFVYEQIEAVKRIDETAEYAVFAVRQKGPKGYLAEVKRLKQLIMEYRPAIVHAHCGPVGAMAVLQRRVPVITTFHGSDVNNPKIRVLSIFVSLFSRCSIFVSEGLKAKMPVRGRHSVVLPCGVDTDIFHPRSLEECKERMGIPMDEKYVLFASAFDNAIKNAPLAQQVMSHFPQLRLREIKNRSREEVAFLIGGAELVLMTSHSEGSPQIIKEAVACGQKVVSVDVGDVKEQLAGLEDCAVVASDEKELVDAVAKVLDTPHRDSSVVPERFDNRCIAVKLNEIYKKINKN